jgi:hypothetical protein
MFLRPSFDLQINTIKKFFRRIKTKPKFFYAETVNVVFFLHAETVAETVKFYMLIQ